MSVKEIKKYIKDLSNKDKKIRQKSCESLEARGILLTNDESKLLNSAVNALEKATKDSDKNVKKKAESAYKTLYNHLQSIEKPESEPEPSTDSDWGSTTTEESPSTTSSTRTSSSQPLEGEPQPALEYILEETLNGTLAINGELISDSIETTGLLRLKNLNSSERIFDINFKIENKGLSSIEDESFHFNEIQGDEEQTVEYSINIEKVDDVAIEFSEAIDTFPDSEEDSNVLVFGQEMSTKIKYNFSAKKTLNSFTLTKELPSGFENVTIETSSIGKANIEGNNVVWKIEDVNEGLSGNLVISGLFKVENLEDISTGKATLEFSSLTDTHSGLKLSEVKEGRVRSRHLVESNELADEPDYWLNKFIFENPSDIEIQLKHVKMTDPNADDPTAEVVSLENPVLIKAGGEWVSEEFKTFSESIPTFNKDIDLQIGSKLSVDTRSKLVLEQGALRVANITATKSYELNEVPSYRETPLPAEIIIENIGAIAYAHLLIKDKVPAHFLAPLKDDMTLTMITEESGEEILNSDSDYEYIVEGDEENADSEKIVLIKCIREVPPGAKIKWNYAPRAYKPLPDHTYDFHTDIEASLIEKAPPLTFTLTEDLTIKVLHQRRKVTIGKTILPGSNKNEYEIELFYKNRGTAVLDKLAIKDFIPKAFTIQSENVEFITTDDDGNELKLNGESSEEDAPSEMEVEGKIKIFIFEQVKPNDKIIIKIAISGEGEYSMRQAQMTFT